MKITIPNKAKEIMQKLIDNGYEVFVCGGFIRDSLLNENPHDIDLFTNCKNILEVFHNGKVIGNEERQNKILTVIVYGIEVSTYRGNGDRTEYGTTIEEHQSTCDLTINSIACDINGNIDMNNKFNKQGIYDLGVMDYKENIYYEKPTINFVGNPLDRIKEDKLRILRAIRFYLKYNGEMDNDTVDIIINNVNLLDTLPKERIREELIKCLQYPLCFNALARFRVLEWLVPEWNMLAGLSGGYNHDEKVGEHMVNAFRVACRVTNDWRIRLAAFMHDVGKCQTFSCEIPTATILLPEEMHSDIIEKNIHFYEHEKVGAKIVEKWMTDLKFSKEDIEFVSTLIRYHMWSYKVGEISKKSYMKMFNKFRETGVSIYDFIMLIYCDHQGNQKKPRIKFGDFITGSWVLSRYWECVYTKEPFSKKDLKLQGGDIIKILGISPGPKVGEIMDSIMEAIMNCELINDRMKIIKWIKQKNII